MRLGVDIGNHRNPRPAEWRLSPAPRPAARRPASSVACGRRRRRPGARPGPLGWWPAPPPLRRPPSRPRGPDCPGRDNWRIPDTPASAARPRIDSTFSRSRSSTLTIPEGVASAACCIAWPRRSTTRSASAKRHRPGEHQGRVFPQAQARGDCARFGRLRILRSQHLERGQARHENGRLADGRRIELGGRPLEADARPDRNPGSRSPGRRVPRGREACRRSIRPMPTCCAPWPGKRSATFPTASGLHADRQLLDKLRVDVAMVDGRHCAQGVGDRPRVARSVADHADAVDPQAAALRRARGTGSGGPDRSAAGPPSRDLGRAGRRFPGRTCGGNTRRFLRSP